MERETVNDQLTREFPALGPLMEAAKTYRERRGTYGPSERMFGKVMAAFDSGKEWNISTEDDYTRFGLIVQIVGKLCRYFHDPNKGHRDSMHDIGVYAFMLEAEDRRIQQSTRDEHAELNVKTVDVESEPSFWRIRNCIDELLTAQGLTVPDEALKQCATAIQRRLTL